MSMQWETTEQRIPVNTFEVWLYHADDAASPSQVGWFTVDSLYALLATMERHGVYYDGNTHYSFAVQFNAEDTRRVRFEIIVGGVTS